MKVLLTGRLFPDVITHLERYAVVLAYSAYSSISRGHLLNLVRDVDGILTLLPTVIDNEVMGNSPNLKIIANCAVGYDNIDVKAATARGILVTNTPDVLTETTADLTWALILATGRRIVEGDRVLRSGGWKLAWNPSFMLSNDVYGKTLGIFGMGRIGKAVAKRAIGFDMNILYNSQTPKPDIEKTLSAQFANLKQLLQRSDFFVVTVPLNRHTYHVIGEDELAIMKKTAYLINPARGSIIDESALFRALKRKQIAGAGLDVFELEPTGPKNPLTKLSNVVLSPHMGSATVETRKAMAMLAAQNLSMALEGKTPKNVVNPEALAKKVSR